MLFSGLGVTLSLVFGCLLLALVAEFCYLLWRKSRRNHTETKLDRVNSVKGMFYGVCRKKKSSSINHPVSVATDQENNKSHNEADLELGIGRDVLLKTHEDEEGVESELMRLHNLAGPPRFLFTIKEETKEDLESDDGKSLRGDNRSRKWSRTKSLSDLMVAIDSDTPFVNSVVQLFDECSENVLSIDSDTPVVNSVASSPLSCGLDNMDSYKDQGGFNPLFESSSAELEFNRFRSSPPPKFKFLRDAEEKLIRRLIEEAQRKAQKNHGCVVPETEVKDLPNSVIVTEDKGKSLLMFKEREQRKVQQHLPQFHSSSSQVLPI